MDRLTDQEWDVLWYASQGLTQYSTGRLLGISTGAVMATRKRVNVKLGTSNITQSVHRATVQGIIGAHRYCGTLAARARHRRRKEPVCAACRRAHDESEAQRKALP